MAAAYIRLKEFVYLPKFSASAADLSKTGTHLAPFMHVHLCESGHKVLLWDLSS